MFGRRMMRTGENAEDWGYAENRGNASENMCCVSKLYKHNLTEWVQVYFYCSGRLYAKVKVMT